MILLIDNYDSFTYNLYQYFGELHGDVTVRRNDEITCEEIEAMVPGAIVISPGPGYPGAAGVSVQAVRRFSGRVPILGVWLGHQAICEAFGGKIGQAKKLMHGKRSAVELDTGCALFAGLSSKEEVGRYHSLIAERASLPEVLEVTAQDELMQVMAVRHKEHKTYGVQFHPESILTHNGKLLCENFCKLSGLAVTPLSAPREARPVSKQNALKPYIFKAIDGEHLSEQEATAAMDCIMSGGATDAQIGSFVTALRMKGETIDEITGFARVMRQKAAPMPGCSQSIDIVGTGGDMANTFNISTTTSFVVAGAGVQVAKHGNRSVSSKSGAADVLEALGVKIAMNPAQAAGCLSRCGLSFLFAQSFHGSMKFAAAPRKEIGVRSVFNILGPLSNPASAEYILLGVYDEQLMEVMARVLQNLGVRGAMVVHGSDGLDEITVCDTTKVCEVRDGKLIKYELDPRDYGMALSKPQDVVGGTAIENAAITLGVLEGETGPRRDIVVLNAACALYTARRADTIEEGVLMAERSIDSGAAKRKLQELKEYTLSL